MSKRQQWRAELERKLKKRQSERPELPIPLSASGQGMIEKVARMLASHQSPTPKTWPGACHSSLARPDLVKARIGDFAQQSREGRVKQQQLEAAYRNGPLGVIPDVNHWAIEEFIWHGAPGDSWHPIEQFLQQHSAEFPPEAQRQLRLWKEARFCVCLLGEVAHDTVTLQDFDVDRGTPVGEPFQAIALNLGGVNHYRGHRGKLIISYLAPWAPDQNLACMMGYGFCVPRDDAVMVPLMLNLRNATAVARRWPWTASPAAKREYLARWQARDWLPWLTERLQFPFEAMVAMPHDRQMRRVTVKRFVPITLEQSKQYGIYFEVPLEGKVDALTTGATTVMPLDIASANQAALAEYSAYRDIVGPPAGKRGMRGAPSFLT